MKTTRMSDQVDQPRGWNIPEKPREPCGLFTRREERAFDAVLHLFNGTPLLDSDSEIFIRLRADGNDEIATEVLMLMHAAYMAGQRNRK